MNIKFESSEVTGGVITVVAKITAKLSDIATASEYGTESLKERVLSAVAEEVARTYLVENKMELVNSISLKEITDAIQLKVIEGFSLQQR